MPTSWHLLDSGPGSGAFNMACDEVLLEAAPRLGQPLLRFYSWTEPAATFGYFQHYNTIASLTSLRPLLRRPTGGGLVPHDRDWTYSLVVPAAHPWYDLKAPASYRQVHEWVRAAFASLGVPTALAPAPPPGRGEQCFVSPAEADVLWQARKIAGAAQRRTRSGLLVQGSVQPPALTADRRMWEAAMQRTATARWGVGWVDWALTPELAERVRSTVRTKYGLAAYHQRR